MEFAALDFETANADMSSICQVGIAKFADGVITYEWKSYVDPEDFFDPIYVSIHGIDESMVVGAPKFPDLANVIGDLAGRVVVTHSAFDRVAMHQAAAKYQSSLPECTWLDSACVARRTWEQFSRCGYGLKNVCKFIGYSYRAHDALEDAKAAGQVILAAMAQTGLDLEGWLKRVHQPIHPETDQLIARDGNPNGELYGEVLVFTGKLSMTRHEAADMAATVGCEVDPGVTKRTTLLVVGDQDVTRLAGHDKSSKYRKAETLISAGHPIRILRETDFRRLVHLSVSSR